jgi:hypothetical protein
MDGETIKKLQDAHDLICEVAQTLDASEQACEQCGLHRKVNWDEARARDDLLGAAKRLDRALDALEDGATPRRKVAGVAHARG